MSVSNPGKTAEWTNDDGFVINPAYYAMRHFAKFTNPGDRVVETTSNRKLLLASSFLSTNERTLTVVLLNRSIEEQTLTLDLGDFEPNQSLRLETTDESSWQMKSALVGAKSQLTLPTRSITTIVATLDDTLPG